MNATDPVDYRTVPQDHVPQEVIDNAIRQMADQAIRQMADQSDYDEQVRLQTRRLEEENLKNFINRCSHTVGYLIRREDVVFLSVPTNVRSKYPPECGAIFRMTAPNGVVVYGYMKDKDQNWNDVRHFTIYGKPVFAFTGRGIATVMPIALSTEPQPDEGPDISFLDRMDQEWRAAMWGF